MWNQTAPAVGLLLIVALFAGCASPSDVDATEMGSATIAPGNKAGVPLILEDSDWQPGQTSLRVIDDAGFDVEVPDQMHPGDNGALVAWVTMGVPSGTDADTHHVVVAVDHEDDESVNARFDVHVDEPDIPLSQGQTVLLTMTLRTLDGAVAFTNDPDIIDSPLPLVPGADPPAENPEPFPFPLNPNPQLPPELMDAVLASGVGHNVQAEAPEAYGPAQIERQEPRMETVPREITEQRTHEIPRQTALQQGLITEDAQEGDPVDVGSALPYVITQLNETTVTIALDVQEGNTYTLHEAWPDATQVTEKTDASVTFRTTPSTAEGETFTWRPEWPNATAVASTDDEAVELRHSPEIGTTYTATTQQGGETQATVQDVGDEQITIAEDNPHPLAAQTLYFELTIEAIQEEQTQQPGLGPGP